MIKKIEGRVRYSKKIKKFISKMKPLKGGEWDLKHEVIDELKKILKVQLKDLQDNKCAYCGLPLDETGKSEREHIAPKGGEKRPKYTEFTFSPYNIVLACNLCNSPEKKGTKDTVDKKDINYKKCDFNIVHPYFDNPNMHYDYVSKDLKIIIQKKSAKGEKSINTFKLNSEAHCIARARIVIYENFSIEEKFQRMLDDALKYRK